MNLKKFGLLLTFSACCGIFAGCGDKDYTFEEALAVTQEKSSSLVNLFIADDIALKGNFDGSLSVKAGENQLVLKGNGEFQSDVDDAVSSDMHFNIDGTVEGMKIPVKADLSFIANTGATYFKLGDFSFKADDSNPFAGFISAYVAEFKDKWFKLDLSAFYEEAGMGDFVQATQEYMDSCYATMREILDSDIQMSLYKEVGHENYQGKFSEYNGKNAYQFVLDEDKFQEVMDKIVALTETYYSNLGSQYGEDMSSAMQESVDMIKNMHFDPFTGNLVIDGEDVIAVYDEMNLNMGDMKAEVSSHIGKDGLYLSLGMNGAMKSIDEEGNTDVENIDLKDALIIDAKHTRGNTYDCTLTLKDNDGETYSVKGSITLDLSDDKISVKVSVPFSNAEIEKADVDFSFMVEKAKSVTITYPEETQDFMELIGGLVGGMMGGDDMDYDMDYDMDDSFDMSGEMIEDDEADEGEVADETVSE